MKGGLGGLMKQAQKMQESMQQAQEELANMEGVGQSGMVQITMTGRHEVRRVEIDPSLMEDDKEMLEDLIAAAINDASHKIEDTNKDKMSGMTAGLDLPAGLKLPF